MWPRLATIFAVPRTFLSQGDWPAVFGRLLALLGRLSLLGSIPVLLLFRSSNPSETVLSIDLIDLSAFRFRPPERLPLRSTASV